MGGAPPKRGVGALLSVSAFNLEEHPCDIYSDSMHLKQITGQTIMYNRIISSFNVES